LTYDLKTGLARPHNREDYITKCTAVVAGGDCPMWLAFLDRVTAGDKELQAYLQRMAGYCLTGVTREHVLFFLYGTGANGKGVFLNTLTAIWGDYAVTASMETFIESHNDRHPTELAHLRGARLVTAQETERGRRWAESKIKALTGGDPITARFMRQDFFTFIPQFKLVIAGNHKPSLRSIDEAIRRRFHLVPFTVTIPAAERDPELFVKLKPEWPGILGWAIDGCLEWQNQGLNPPPAVRAATDKYLAEEDGIARWIEDCCVTGKGLWAIGDVLWRSWKAWAEVNNELPGSRKAFAIAMEDRGHQPQKSQEVRGYAGIDVKRPEDARGDLD
jgi:putative DNA primase/helicase